MKANCFDTTRQTHFYTNGSWVPFYKQLRVHNPNLDTKYMELLNKNLKIHSNHNSAHVTTAELLSHVQSCDEIGSLKSKLEQIKFSQVLKYELINGSLVTREEMKSGSQALVDVGSNIGIFQGGGHWHNFLWSLWGGVNKIIYLYIKGEVFKQFSLLVDQFSLFFTINKS